MERGVYSSESVTEGHPDKLCDQISDSILDAFIALDPMSRTGVECMAAHDTLIIAGEVGSTATVDVEALARKVIADIGYTDKRFGFYPEVEIINRLNKQSPEIAQGVLREGGEIGAGDQGMMYGYACNETEQLMPLTISLAHALTRRLAEVRKKNIIPHLGPDGKSQVSVAYVDGKPQELKAVVIAQQHTEEVSEEELKKQIVEHVITPVCGAWLTHETKLHINATGAFILGGPEADTGLTGRKIIVDTYGGVGRHGGGAFSGKDPSKVDRSAAYMARHIAKNVVAKGFANECEVQLSYAIGVAEPTSVAVHTFGSGTKSPGEIETWIRDTFKMTPRGIIDSLNLRQPIYRQTASYGHFGRPEFPWEKVIQ